MRVLFLTHAFPRQSGDVAGAFLLRLARALVATGTSCQEQMHALCGRPVIYPAQLLRATLGAHNSIVSTSPEEVRK